MNKWIDWAGGPCPLPEIQMVAIECRNGEVEGPFPACRFRWGVHTGQDFDIVRYCARPLEPTGVEAQVCDDIARRQHFGLAKYGTTVADNPLTHKQWLEHAYFEALDMAIYLKRAMQEPEGKQ